MKRRTASAFTILELLVVVAIIGIISLLGFGAMGSLRSSASGTECVNNLRQIHQAFMLRVTDLNGQFPSATDYPSYASWARNWSYDLIARKLLNDWNTFRCPAAPKEWSFSGHYVHYGMNSYLPPAENGVPASRAFGRISNVSNPAQTVAFTDSGFPNRSNPTSGYYLLSDAARIAGRHNGKANVIFVDGHLEQLAPETASQPNGVLYRLYRQ